MLAWLRAGSFVGAECPCGASLRRHPGAGRRRMVAVDAGLFRNGRTRIRRVGSAPRRRRRGRPFAVRAIRRTGRWRVLAICGTTSTRDDHVGMCCLCSTLSWCSCCWWLGLVPISRPRRSHSASGYVVLRVAGQLAAGAVARRVVGVHAPRDLGLHLLPPGVFGVGFALNAVSVIGADASMLLAVVVMGTIGSELVAVLSSPRSVGE